jgi:hypothetical protein
MFKKVRPLIGSIVIFFSLMVNHLYANELNENGFCLIDGSLIQLQGNIELETFAGPPNYESIENGDQELKYWILTVKPPINCAYRFDMEKEEMFFMKGIFDRFQLVYGNSELFKEAEESGREVSVSGELMSGHTGYHQTDFLIFLEDNKLVYEKTNE